MASKKRSTCNYDWMPKKLTKKTHKELIKDVMKKKKKNYILIYHPQNVDEEKGRSHLLFLIPLTPLYFFVKLCFSGRNIVSKISLRFDIFGQ